MSSNDIFAAFAEYARTSGKLDEMNSLTDEMEKSLSESVKMLSDLRKQHEATKSTESNQEDADDSARIEEIGKFLEAEPPRFLLPNMEHLYNCNIDVKESLSKTKDLLEQIQVKVPEKQDFELNKDFDISSDLTQYAESLEQCSKQLAFIKDIPKMASDRNPELEEKFEKLCIDVDLLSTMIHVQTKTPKSNVGTTSSTGLNAFRYKHQIDKVIKSINEASFLLQNNN